MPVWNDWLWKSGYGFIWRKCVHVSCWSYHLMIPFWPSAYCNYLLWLKQFISVSFSPGISLLSTHIHFSFLYLCVEMLINAAKNEIFWFPMKIMFICGCSYLCYFEMFSNLLILIYSHWHTAGSYWEYCFW